MDFTQFINSKDIRDYHRKIKYQYDAVEAAWLVWQCHSISLKEKHSAWRWIMNNMPDQSLEESVTTPGATNKLHSILREYRNKNLHESIDSFIDMQNSAIESFTKNRNGSLYTYEYEYRKESGDHEHEWTKKVFSNWNDCLDSIKQNADEDIISASVFKLSTGEDIRFDWNGKGYIDVSPDGEIMDVDAVLEDDPENFKDIERFFYSQWLEFPVPFKKGDIVTVDNSYIHIGPVVLDGIIIPPGRDEKKYRERRKRSGGDFSDMNFWGYYMGDTGDVNWNEHFIGVDNDTQWDYMDVEYYRDELKGMDRCLKPISSFLKGEIGVDLLLNAYNRIMMEEYYNTTMPWQYTKEGLAEAGILSTNVNE